MDSLLPPHAGLLPYWQLLVRHSPTSHNQTTLTHDGTKMSAFSLFNTTQCYRGKENALRTYAGPNAAAQVTDFSSRMFGTWTLLSCLIRVYAAYRIEDESMYILAFATYVIAMTHFAVEWLGFGTMTAGVGLLRVAIVPVVTMSWMLMQWGFYVKN